MQQLSRQTPFQAGIKGKNTAYYRSWGISLFWLFRAMPHALLLSVWCHNITEYPKNEAMPYMLYHCCICSNRSYEGVMAPNMTNMTVVCYRLWWCSGMLHSSMLIWANAGCNGWSKANMLNMLNIYTAHPALCHWYHWSYSLHACIGWYSIVT